MIEYRVQFRKSGKWIFAQHISGRTEKHISKSMREAKWLMDSLKSEWKGTQDAPTEWRIVQREVTKWSVVKGE